MTHQLGDAAIQDEYRAQMNALVKGIDEIFNGDLKGDDRHTGFVLLVFPFGETEGRCNFISNVANREDIVCLFKEIIARFQGQPESLGTA
jgi:hypothetical protein